MLEGVGTTDEAFVLIYCYSVLIPPSFRASRQDMVGLRQATQT